MLVAVCRRLVEMVLVMFSISIVVFLIFFATPGVDPAARIAGRNASPETLAAIRHDFGLDRSLPVQYADLMTRLIVTRDLASFANRGQLVVPSIVAAMPVTLSLVAGATVLWVTLGVAAGLAAAVTKGKTIDRLITIAAVVGISLPVFWLAEVMNLLSQDRLHDTFLFSWVPPLGYQPLMESPAAWFKALVIPWVTLSVLYAGLYARVLRASLLDVLEEDFIRTARAKGISETRVLLRHALPASLTTFVSLFGLDFGALVGGGTVLTEVVFGLQGVGKLTYTALQNLDLPFIMATILYGGFFVVAANALVDVCYVILDPRARDAPYL